MVNYHYMISNNKIVPIFEKIKTAAQPPKFTYDFLKNLGFTSSNDRAIIVVLKNLGFLTGDGTPTTYYKDLRDATRAKKVLATQIKEYYKDLFAIDTNMNQATDVEIKGAISRVTGKEEKEVKRILSTFKALCAYADFDGSEEIVSYENDPSEDIAKINTDSEKSKPNDSINLSPDFHYNIQIHLPATTDISVYNAIFKSIKENLFK